MHVFFSEGEKKERLIQVKVFTMFISIKSSRKSAKGLAATNRSSRGV
jgi:hypothetical protein